MESAIRAGRANILLSLLSPLDSGFDFSLTTMIQLLQTLCVSRDYLIEVVPRAMPLAETTVMFRNVWLA